MDNLGPPRLFSVGTAFLLMGIIINLQFLLRSMIVAQLVELQHHTISPNFEEGTPHLVYLERTSHLDNILLQNSQENEGCAMCPANNSILQSFIWTDRREVQQALTSWRGEMDSRWGHPFINRDMRLVLFCNNCSGRQSSSNTHSMLRDVSVVSLLLIFSNARQQIVEISNFLREGKWHGTLVS